MGRTSRIPARGGRLGALALAVGWEVLRRPGLWRESLLQLRPAVSTPYRSFRSVTAYGDPSRHPPVGDVVAWLAWARSFRRCCARPPTP
ncbi:MAG: hypothetical protein OXG47_06610 [bacterium]|nr:hypothetical protein [bacterium]